MSDIKIGPFTFTSPVSFGPTFYPVDKKELQKGLANLELGMNWAGYIVPFLPFVGEWAGRVRIMVGSVEGIIGLVSAAYHYALSYRAKNEQDREQAMNRVWENWEYAKHGAANIGRGCLEQIRVVNLLVGILWDYAGKRMQYQAEKEIELQKAQKKADGTASGPLSDLISVKV